MFRFGRNTQAGLSGRRTLLDLPITITTSPAHPPETQPLLPSLRISSHIICNEYSHHTLVYQTQGGLEASHPLEARLVFLVITRCFRSTATSQRHIRHRSRRGVSSAERSTSTQRFSGLACEPSLVRSIQSVCLSSARATTEISRLGIHSLRYAVRCAVLCCVVLWCYFGVVFLLRCCKDCVEKFARPSYSNQTTLSTKLDKRRIPLPLPWVRTGLLVVWYRTVPHLTIPTVSHRSVTVRYLPV